MNKIYWHIIIILLVGTSLLVTQFSFGLNEFSYGLKDLFVYPFWAVVFFVLLIWSFTEGKKNYRFTKKKISFLPVLLCVLFPVTTVLGIFSVRKLIYCPTKFKAICNNCKIGDDVLELDFKENGYLLIHESFTFTLDFYAWGKYHQKGDTIYIHMRKLEVMHDTAILHNDSLQFSNDKFRYIVLSK